MKNTNKKFFFDKEDRLKMNLNREQLKSIVGGLLDDAGDPTITFPEPAYPHPHVADGTYVKRTMPLPFSKAKA